MEITDGEPTSSKAGGLERQVETKGVLTRYVISTHEYLIEEEGRTVGKYRVHKPPFPSLTLKIWNLLRGIDRYYECLEIVELFCSGFL